MSCGCQTQKKLNGSLYSLGKTYMRLFIQALDWDNIYILYQNSITNCEALYPVFKKITFIIYDKQNGPFFPITHTGFMTSQDVCIREILYCVT